MKLFFQIFFAFQYTYFFRATKLLSFALSTTLFIWSNASEALLLNDMQLKNGQRIGIYIGTFDPIHNGHSSTIEQALKQGKLDFLIVIPNNAATHKPNASPFDDRLQMVKNIYEHSSKVIVPNDGNIGWPIAPAILEKINNNPEAKVSLIQIYGDDVIESKETQKKERSTYKGIKEWIVIARSEDSFAKVDQLQSSLEREQPDLKIQVFKSTNPGQSSTKIKASIALTKTGTSIEGLDPRVSSYIKRVGLYQNENKKGQVLSIPNKCSTLYGNLIKDIP